MWRSERTLCPGKDATPPVGAHGDDVGAVIGAGVLGAAKAHRRAIRLLLAQIESSQCVPLSDPAAIEMFGWLELPLHTAPAMIVTSFNEGFVPTSVNADMFLPNRLRRRLGL